MKAVCFNFVCQVGFISDHPQNAPQGPGLIPKRKRLGDNNQAGQRVSVGNHPQGLNAVLMPVVILLDIHPPTLNLGIPFHPEPALLWVFVSLALGLIKIRELLAQITWLILRLC